MRTGVPCYDYPENKRSPFFSVEITATRPRNTKTMYLDEFSVSVHCIAPPVKPYSNAPVLKLVQSLEEALTSDIALPEPFEMFRQEYGGMQAVKRDETGEGHAVLSFQFWVCYGYRCK